MNAGKAVYGILSANSGVTDIVGTRIFPEIAEQEAVTPFVIYQLQSVAPEDTHDGPSKLDEVRFEFLCYADSYNEAADLGVAVRGALDRVSGTYNGVNVESVQFNDVDVEIEYDPRRYSQVLKFTFRIKRDDIEIALGTPVTGAELGDLSDVDVSGVTNGQLIAYNSTTGNWEAADDAGGAETLDDLTDVDAGAPSAGQLLSYGQGAWTTIDQDELTLPIGSVTGLQTELNLKANSADFSNVDNTSDADKPVSTATQTALNAKADTSAVPSALNDLSDVTIAGTPTANQALIYDGTSGVFKSLPSFTNRFVDEAENNKQSIVPFAERVYTVKSDGDGIFIDPDPDTPSAGKVIKRKIYHKTGFLESGAVIGDFTLIHTFADDTAYSATESTFEGFRDGDTYGTPPYTLIQTWEEVTAAPSFTGLLNETYGSGAAAAYSVRRLNGNYTGAAIQVERSSDNTTQDIGFDVDGNLDESALTTFCTGTVCKVRTWYDQSVTGGTGSGNDAQQTDHANQPTIYTGGAIVKENGRVAFTSSKTTTLSLSTRITDVQSAFLTLAPTDVNVLPKTDWGYFLLGDTTTSDYHADYNDNWLHPTFASASVRNGSNYLNGFAANLTTTARTEQQYLVSLISTSATNTVGTISKDRTFTNRSWVGSRQEIVLYASDKSTDRTSIESNIGDYFTQNTPLLDTYTGAAACYSLRLMRTAYTGSAIRVRRSSDNTEQDIGFNVFGELDTVSLASFCSGTNGFVKVWYDQASTNDATQTNTAKQPKIYDSTTGVTLNSNSKPAVYFQDGVSNSLPSTVTHGSDPIFISAVSEVPAGATNERSNIYGGGGGNDFEFRNWANDQVAIRVGNGTTVSANAIAGSTVDQVILLTGYNISSSLNLFLNGTASASNPVTASYSVTFPAGGIHASRDTIPNYIAEIVVYESDQSSNRTGIESNIATYHGITI